MISSNLLSTILARLKVYEASIQQAMLFNAGANPGDTVEVNPGANPGANPGENIETNLGTNPVVDHRELRQAIADLEMAQSQIVPGSLVRLKATGEMGRVVLIFNTEGFDDAYIAFWGHTLPNPAQAPDPRPYLLRYCLSSLELVS